MHACATTWHAAAHVLTNASGLPGERDRCCTLLLLERDDREDITAALLLNYGVILRTIHLPEDQETTHHSS